MLVCLFLLGGFALQRKDCKAAFGRRVHCSVQPPPPAWPGRAVPETGRNSWDGPKPISIIGSTGSIGTQVQPYKRDTRACLDAHFRTIFPVSDFTKEEIHERMPMFE